MSAPAIFTAPGPFRPSSRALAPGIAGIAYAFPAQRRTVAELADDGALESDPALLTAFGFEGVHVAVAETPYELALRAAARLLEDGAVDPATVDLLIYGGAATPIAFATPAAAAERAAAACTIERFAYPACRLQYELGLLNAAVLGVEQLACTSLLAATRLARSLCLGGEARRVLCVSAEFFPAAAGREAIFNCTSDAGCAVLVDRDCASNQVVAAQTVSKGYYWDPVARRDEIVASYFPTSRTVIARTVAAAGWTPEQVDWVIPHNVSRRSWDILMRLAALPNARLWDANIARHGHTLAGDNFINLHDALLAGDVRAGHRVLLFSYGFGAHWTALALEV